jgi:hypothetical protein
MPFYYGKSLLSSLQYFKERSRKQQDRTTPIFNLKLIEFAVGKLDVKQRVLEGNDLLSPLAVQGDGNLGHSIFSSSVSRG